MHSAPAHIIERGKSDALLNALVFLVLVCSGFVLREPAPYDVLLIGLMGLSVMTGLRVPRGLGLPATLLMIFFVFDLIGVLHAINPEKASVHAFVTIYLGMSSLFFACLLARDSEKMLRIIFIAYAIGAVLTALAGIAGYFGGIEIFTENSRARGMFKDPNVFGPYLIPPALYAMMMLIDNPLRKAWIWMGALGILIVAVLLSFSRAAWAHFLVSAAMMVGLMFLLSTDWRKRGRIVTYVTILGAVGVLGLMTLISMPSVSGLFTERFSLTQSYDVAESGGRFQGHLVALKVIFQNPLGVGPYSFAVIYGADPHNVYLQTALTAGWIGGLAYLVLVLVTLWRGLDFLFRRTPIQEFFIITYSTFLPLAIEGIIIDTDHWRHFYLLLGLIWGMMLAFPRSRARFAAMRPPGP
ncbi:MAG: hypothetical protein C0605_03635 [Hyphomicrobiales bacterium]|nr:MAG: hypothetical protein C0605_03635 [Hyphomicrobiales bacterium]